ncbi:GNAT family N-acetyltransferase [Planomicrobium sp. CPCC 101079]|uniref:GNAT family N-acetyltransferase n=1 Tax=Planomicrobium sp. CPCC 101079 TaxID=2599618 RepID=UPI0011B54FB1|nr:GNAT family N-acetyltransferase [Planomicrobium sp. CPCC 101079]TWT09320.1 GNAT family N-acetyltransferase [Planomicrobium sp. CPCC 101079]
MATERQIIITTELPADFKKVLNLYEALGWNSFELKEEDFREMCMQSWFVVYAYDRERLVGMGRIISDGVITAIICGLGIAPSHQHSGIGKQLMQRMIDQCESNGVIAQLMCEENLEPYYEAMGFMKFASGMTRNSLH